MLVSELTARLRPERDLTSRWGIFCGATQAWLGVHFSSKTEADEAIQIIERSRKR